MFEFLRARSRSVAALAVFAIASTITSLAFAANLSTFAGGGPIGDDNSANWGTVNFASDIVVNPWGTVYIADTKNHRVREINGIVTTFVGTGISGSTGDGGDARDATLNQPIGLALDASGNLYIAERGGNRIRKVTPGGTISTFFGNGSSATLDRPEHLAIASNGTMYVSESSSNRVRKIVAGVISPFAGNGTAGSGGDGGSATLASLNSPQGLLVASDGSVLIADMLNNAIRRVDAAGNIDLLHSMETPIDLAMNSAGELHVVDGYGVQRRSSWDGSWFYVAGDRDSAHAGIGFTGDEGPAILAEFYFPTSLAISPDDHIYINDYYNERIRVVDPNTEIIHTVLGPGVPDEGEMAYGAYLSHPAGMARDNAGNLYVSERFRQRVVKITRAGAMTTFAGNGLPGFQGDGGAATSAKFTLPTGLAIDTGGNLLIADFQNNRVRTVSPAGVINSLTTINFPESVAVSPYSGSIYVGASGGLYQYNGLALTRIAGGGASPGNNVPATTVKVGRPAAIGFDSAGNVYFTDPSQHAVRKLATNGTLSTVAGTIGSAGSTGDGGAATSALLSSPRALYVESNGDFYVSDSSSKLRKVTAGTIQTVAGTTTVGFNGDGDSLTTRIDTPWAITAGDEPGSLFFSDMYNNRVRSLATAAPKPVISMSDASVVEGGYFAKFNITLSRTSTQAVTFDYASSNGSAVAGSDYEVKTGSATMPAGSTFLSIWVPVLDDGVMEPAEEFHFQLSNLSTNVVVDDVSATGFITDNDPFDVPGAPTSVSASISGSTVTVTFAAPASDGGSPIQAYYVGGPPESFCTFTDTNAGSLSLTHVLTNVAPNQACTYSVIAYNAAGGGQFSAPSNAVTYVRPDLYITFPEVQEGNSGSRVVIFNFNLDRASPNDVDFDVATEDMTATAGSDYVARSGVHVHIPAGAINATFEVTVKGDTTPEADEEFRINLTNVVGAWVPSVNQSSAKILDDEAGGGNPPSLSINNVIVTEGNFGTRLATFTVSLSKAASVPVTVDVVASGLGALAGSDFVATSASGFLLPAGTISKTFAVTIKGDTTAEDDENFAVYLMNASGATIAEEQGTGWIVNDDGGEGQAGLTIGDVSISEGNSGTKLATFTLSLTAAKPWPVTYDILTSDVSAAAGSDFVASKLVDRSIPAGQTSATFSVVINGDAALEPDENFKVFLWNVTGAHAIDDTAVGTITNDDTASPPTLSIGDVSIAEGNSLTKTATFTVTLSAPQAVGVYFDYATASGSAEEGTDFVGKSMAALKIPAGTTSKTFMVTINGDKAVEPDETFLVNLSNPVGAGVTIADGQAVGTITNDDAPPPPTLSIGNVTIAEGNSLTKTATFTVTLSAPQAAGVYFDFATASGSAEEGTDFVGKSMAALKILAGTTSKTFMVTINGDKTVEPDETFLVNLSNPVGAGVTIADGQAVGTITNDDAAPISTLSIGDVAIAEGNSLTKTATFTVTLSAPQAVGVYFDFATASGSAEQGTDFVGKSMAALKIPAGTTSKTFMVTINGDKTVEPDETFLVNLSNPVGAGVTIADGQAVGTITNDDAAALTMARFATGGLVDDIDDSNGGPQLSNREYTLLLADTARRLCARTGKATLIGIDGVENRAVLADLADAANLACVGEPRYQAVMAEQASIGFLVEATSDKDARGVKVIAAPTLDAKAGVSDLTVQVSGHARPITLVLPQPWPSDQKARSAQLLALGQRVAATLKADPQARMVLIGGVTLNALRDLSARDLAKLRVRALPAERILLSPALQSEFDRSTVSYLPAMDRDAAAQVLQLQQ